MEDLPTVEEQTKNQELISFLILLLFYNYSRWSLFTSRSRKYQKPYSVSFYLMKITSKAIQVKQYPNQGDVFDFQEVYLHSEFHTQTK